MLVHCPKCSFEQPADQYCARCGVDMQHFHKSEKLTFTRMAKNPLVQILFAVIVALFVGQYIIETTSIESLEPLRIFKRANLSESLLPSAPSLPSMQAQADSATENLESPDSSSNDTHNSLAKTSERKIRITYFEIFARLKEMVLEESRRSGQFNQFGDHVAGFLPMKISKFPGAAKDFKALSNEEFSFQHPASKPWSLSLPNSSAQFGFNLESEEQTDEALRLKLDIQRSWFDNSDPQTFNENNFPFSFDLSKEGAFFVIGILPRHFPAEFDEAVKTHAIFQILKSRSFQDSTSEFGVLIEWE